jgi:HSP20 family protein
MEAAKKSAPAQTSLPDVWQSFHNEMDRLFDRFGSGFGLPSLRRMFEAEPGWRSSFSFSMPAIDMSEDETAYKISAELPGMDAKDVDVSITGDMLVLRDEKRQEKEQKDKNYHFSERAYGSFQRSFELPPSVDRNRIAADFSKGVLSLTLPKTANAQQPAKKSRSKPLRALQLRRREPSRRLNSPHQRAV